jgi:hypothetical protein
MLVDTAEGYVARNGDTIRETEMWKGWKWNTGQRGEGDKGMDSEELMHKIYHFQLNFSGFFILYLCIEHCPHYYRTCCQLLGYYKLV